MYPSLTALFRGLAPVFIACFLICPDSAARPPYVCALRAPPLKDAAVGYRLRGNRCEGLYVQQVSGEVEMRLLGFHVGKPTFDAGAVASIPIRVATEAGVQGVLLRVTSRDERVHYQMDTDGVEQGKPYEWSTQVIRSNRVGLTADKVAAVACTNRCVTAPGTKYFPVTIGLPAGDAKQEVTLIVRPTVALSRLLVSVTRKGAEASPKRQVGSTYPAHRAIPLHLGAALAQGENSILVEGYNRREELAATWFGTLYMPGP